METKQNKFIKFIYDNDIVSNSQAYIISKIACNPTNKPPFIWFKLLQVKTFEYNGEIKRQIYILDYYSKNIEESEKFSVGQLVKFDLSNIIGKKCSIVSISEV